MTGIPSITIAAAVRRLNCWHNGRDIAAKSCALLLFKQLDHCSYQIAGHVTAPTKNIEVAAQQSSDCSRYPRRVHGRAPVQIAFLLF